MDIYEQNRRKNLPNSVFPVSLYIAPTENEVPCTMFMLTCCSQRNQRICNTDFIKFDELGEKEVQNEVSFHFIHNCDS